MLNYVTGYAVVQVVFLVVIALLVLIPFLSGRFERSAVAQRDYEEKKHEAEHQRWMEKKRVEDVKSGRLIEQPPHQEG